MASVSYRRVRKAFDKTVVIDGLDLDIGDGEFVVFVGPSGCGKTTLLRLLAGLEDLSGGDIRIGARSVADVPARDRNIAMVFQNYALYPHMSVAENMGFGMKVRGTAKAEREAKVRAAASLLNLDGLLERKPRALSGGQRQRVAMGRAIVRDPHVFLMDEPLSNLDAQLRSQMRTDIKDLQNRLGTTTIYVTHDQVEAMTMADRIVVLDRGAIQQFGTPADLYDRPANRFVAGFIGTPGINFIDLQRDGAERFRTPCGEALPVPDSLRVRLDSLDKVVLGVRPRDLAVVNCEASPVRWPAVVKLTEPLGGETLVHAHLGEIPLTLRIDGTVTLKSGAPIDIGFDPANPALHMFDAPTGVRLV